MQTTIPPLTTVFATLSDPRQHISKRHPLSQTLTFIVLALLHGECSLRGIAAWLQAQRWHLKAPFHLRHAQVPSYGTMRRALLAVELGQLEYALRDWAAAVVVAQRGTQG
jgi:hypothetical protein